MRTLLLNASSWPIRVIPWDRAIKMRYEGTVDVVAEYDEVIKSPSVSWRMPAVVRERASVKVKHGVRFSPANVKLRDRYRCQYCGLKFDPSLLECEHVVPKSHGGKRNWENIVAACRSCNARKANRECDEIGMFPINRPVRPKSLPARMPQINRETAPVEWLAYLPVAA